MKITLLALATLLLTACGTNEKVEKLEKQVQEFEQQLPSRASTVETKIKCQKYGEENYQFMNFDDGFSDFTFYYSPVLDTCVGEREDFGPGVMHKFGMFDMFKSGIGSWIFDYTSWCEGEDCLTLQEYQKKKSKLLGER